MRDSLIGWALKHRGALIGALFALLYIAWAIPFIMESSVLAIDGRRYFNLFDDAMISMRYAWNFSHGQGLVWNAGERVEGYTNLLLTLVMSVFTGLLDKSTAALAIQILGVVSVLGCGILLWKLSEILAQELDEAVRPVFRAGVVLIALTYYPLSFWSLSGMETGILTLLILACLYILERHRTEAHNPDLLLVAGLLGLAYLTRPDSIIFSIPLLAYGIDTLRTRRWQAALLAVCCFLVFPLGQEVFRIQYYGAFLPNTYYLKLTGMPLIDRLRNGWGFIELYLLTHALILGVGLLGCILRPDRRKVYYGLLVLLPILYEIWVGGDPLPLWRIMAPVQPLAAILFVLGTIELLRRAGAAVPTRKGTRSFALVTAAGILTANLLFLPQMLLLQSWFPTNFYAPRVNAAVAIDQVTTDNASVGVFAAGVIPYYSGRWAYDFLGRTDPYIANLPADLSGALSMSGMYSVPGHNKYDLQYSIEQKQPTYIDNTWWATQDVSAWVSTHYVQVDYRGIRMWLKRNAPEVKWDLVTP